MRRWPLIKTLKISKDKRVSKVNTGLDIFLRDPLRFVKGKRVGLVANPTTVNHHLKHAVDLLHKHPDIHLTKLFAPEHGLYGNAQDMEAVEETTDPNTGLPVVSLYGFEESSLKPTEEQLQDVDVLVFDLQDIGTRYYTFAASMALCMQACAASNIAFLVLDRPNPINGKTVEGGGIEPHLRSFVGLYPLPQRHGLTLGELATLYNATFDIGCDLEVVCCKYWQRSTYFDETHLPWVMPSPNMPYLETALVYPGLCLLEGTNVSEGRGTTRPFELFGAPFVRGPILARELKNMDLPGVLFRPCYFQPSFQKHAGLLCEGVQIHVFDREIFLPVKTGLAILMQLRRLFPDAFHWRTERYEFRDDVPAVDLLTGHGNVRTAIDTGRDFETILSYAFAGAETYAKNRTEALLYA